MSHMLLHPRHLARPGWCGASGSAVLVAVGVALGILLLASVGAAAPGGKWGGDAFPGRNGEIVFSLGGRDYFPDLFVMRPDGTKLRRITRSRGSDVFPEWSPDGKSLVFISDRSRPRNEGSYEIYLMRANGTGLRRVTHDRFVDYQPDWAPDGQHLVFVSTRPFRSSALCVMNINGTGFRRLPLNGTMPAWSPDGETIAFVRFDASSGSEAIWLINPDGSNPRQLTRPPRQPEFDTNGADWMPDWAPDGKQIAFSRRYRGRTDIYTIRRDGTGLRRLTKGAGQHSWPAWSPDGRRIVFVTALYQRRRIDVMNADGTHEKRLSTGRGEYVEPDWRPLP